MHDEVYALLTQPPLERGMEFEFARERFLRARVRFRVEINVATAQVIPYPRPEQQGARFHAKVALHFFAYGVSLLIGESHF